jgi:hypothetical protein
LVTVEHEVTQSVFLNARGEAAVADDGTANQPAVGESGMTGGVATTTTCAAIKQTTLSALMTNDALPLTSAAAGNASQVGNFPVSCANPVMESVGATSSPGTALKARNATQPLISLRQTSAKDAMARCSFLQQKVALSLEHATLYWITQLAGLTPASV